MEFLDQGAEFYEAQIHQLQVHRLKSQAAKLGLNSVKFLHLSVLG